MKMIIDKQLLMSEDQAITATAVSTNVIDLGAAGVAEGHPLRVLAQVTANFAALTSLKCDVQTATDAAFTSPVILQGDSLTLANSQLVAGEKFTLGTLSGNKVLRYVRLNYTVTGDNATAGTITASLVLDDQTNE